VQGFCRVRSDLQTYSVRKLTRSAKGASPRRLKAKIQGYVAKGKLDFMLNNADLIIWYDMINPFYKLLNSYKVTELNYVNYKL